MTLPTLEAKINSKWIIDLNVKSKTIKLLDRNRREYFHDLGIDKDFLNITPKPTNDKGNSGVAEI